jgi:acetyltransferase-like isoleucine patch superfamily enzyme
MRRLRTALYLWRARRFMTAKAGLHIGKGCNFWAPSAIKIGQNVYIGKYVAIECDANIGDCCLIANMVGIVGRWDHDYRAIGIPVRFAPWIGGQDYKGLGKGTKVDIADDVWIGFGATILSGTKIGTGAIISAGAVVVSDVQEYEIVAGVPAKVIGTRFNEEERQLHRSEMKKWDFKFSERGYEYWSKRLRK